MTDTDYKFPMVDDEGKLFDRFPLIVLHLTSGERIELNYFSEFANNYKPTRYMVESEFIPLVEYHSYFISPQWTCREFIRHTSDRLKKEQVLQISNDEFVFMNNVCKIGVIEQCGDIICFGKGEWNDKFFVSTDSPYVSSIHDIVTRKRQKEPTKFDGKKEVDDFINGLLPTNFISG